MPAQVRTSGGALTSSLSIITPGNLCSKYWRSQAQRSLYTGMYSTTYDFVTSSERTREHGSHEKKELSRDGRSLFSGEDDDKWGDILVLI